MGRLCPPLLVTAGPLILYLDLLQPGTKSPLAPQMVQESFSGIPGGQESSDSLYFVICHLKQEYHEREIS